MIIVTLIVGLLPRVCLSYHSGSSHGQIGALNFGVRFFFQVASRISRDVELERNAWCHKHDKNMFMDENS